MTREQVLEAIKNTIAAARAQGRREGLEEAAKLCSYSKEVDWCMSIDAARDRIRAAIAQEPKGRE